jgi:fructose-specific phosphotransferase system IIC component
MDMVWVMFTIGALIILVGVIIGVLSGTFWGFMGALVGGFVSSMIFFALAQILDNQKTILSRLQ